MNKKIANVVFYKFWDPTREDEMQQACIFYEDGSVKNVSREEGLDAAYEIAKADRIKTKAEFVNIINTRRIYTLSGSEFERRFKEFLGKGVALVPATEIKPVPQVAQPTSAVPVTPTTKPVIPVVVPEGINTPDTKTGNNNGPKEPIVIPVVPAAPVTPATPITPATPVTPAAPVTPAVPITPVAPVTPAAPVVPGTNPTDPTTTPTEPTTTQSDKDSDKKKKGLFSRLWAKVTAVVLAITIAFTGGFLVGRNTKSGDIINNNISTVQNNIEPQDEAYLNLIARSTNEEQKLTMTHQGKSLDVFNKDFANAHIEEGKDIKAALTWDEMMALNIAYNTYTKDQIKIMFNGAEVDSTAMSNAYKNATLQLMGAYVISDRNNPVNSSEFLIDEEQKAFVEKYNDLFLQMKEKTGAEQVVAIDAFYAELYKDFPISDEVREEGISHADSRKLVEPYKAAVTPIVAAAEIMFQNTDGIDHTLSDKAIAYFNDLGLCNLVDEQFERAETITLSADTDESQPLYEEFRAAKIDELIREDNYPIDDVHRDLSQLAEFQKWVNGHFKFVDGINTGEITPNVQTETQTIVTTHTETSTNTVTTTTTTSDRNKAVELAGEAAVVAAENAVDQQLEAENAAAKAAAERNAAEEAARQQAAADAERAQHEAEVDKDDQEMQDMIEDANGDINQGDNANENDFGDHNVDFDDEHSNAQGDLDDSVKDITTDGSGAVDEDHPLPDPNQTGAVFDGQSSGTVLTNEQIVDAYIASLEGQGPSTSGAEIYEYEEPYQYTK